MKDEEKKKRYDSVDDIRMSCNINIQEGIERLEAMFDNSNELDFMQHNSEITYITATNDFDIWLAYRRKYFKSQRLVLEFGTEKFKELLEKSFNVQQNLYRINHDRSNQKYLKDGYIDIDRWGNIAHRDMYEFWGNLACPETDDKLEVGKKYIFDFNLPIKNNIPTFDEFIDEYKEDIRKQKEEAEAEKNKVEEPMPLRPTILTPEELIKVVEKEKLRKRRLIGKKIEKYDKDGNLVATFKDRQDCIKQDNISKQSLYNVLKGKRKTYKGFIYKEID